jgi:hypothetical protein
VTQALRESYRRKIGRARQPTAAIIDSQSVRTSEMGGPRGGPLPRSWTSENESFRLDS